MTTQMDGQPRPMKKRSQDGRSPEAMGGLAAKLRRVFLRSLVGSLVLAAAMGLYAFLLGRCAHSGNTRKRKEVVMNHETNVSS